MKKLSKREYNTIHKFIGRRFDKTGVCEFCKHKKRTEWSNRTGNYKLNRMDWQELCKSCHYRYDVDILGRRTYEDIGGALGRSNKGATGKRGFAFNPQLAKQAGAKGGKISRRGKA